MPACLHSPPEVESITVSNRQFGTSVMFSESDFCRRQFRLVIGSPIPIRPDEEERKAREDVDQFWLWGSNDVIRALVLVLRKGDEEGREAQNGSTPPFSSLSIVQDCTNLTSRLAYYFLARKLVRASCSILSYLETNYVLPHPKST